MTPVTCSKGSGRSERLHLIRARSCDPNTVAHVDKAPIPQIDDAITKFLQRWSITVLRIAVAIVFVWFGALKVFDVTPVTDLVADTVYWVDPDWFVPLLGLFEIMVGVGLLMRRAPRAVLGLFALQMAGTFLVLIVQPEVAFRDGNLLLLTVEGEFVVKKLVLLAAGMVVGATVRRRQASPGPASNRRQPPSHTSENQSPPRHLV